LEELLQLKLIQIKLFQEVSIKEEIVVKIILKLVPKLLKHL
jgi:hypothetical protein